MYKVIHYFTDLQDGGHPYRVGDTYPRDGVTVSDERAEELSGSSNRQGVPLIEQVGGTPYTKTQINRMGKEKLVGLASGSGIDCDGMSGADLKAALIEKLGL